MKPRPTQAVLASSALARAALLACAALTVMSGTTLAPALPSIRHAFAREPDVDWLVRLVVTMPALAIALTAPWVGRIADRLGARSVLLFCLVLYGSAGASGLFLGDLRAILVCRGLLGVAAAGTMTASTAIAAATLDGDDRTRFLARQASLMSLTGVASVTVGGLLAAVHWRAPFVLYLTALPLIALVRGAISAPSRPQVELTRRKNLEDNRSLVRVEQGSPSGESRSRIYGLAVMAMAFVFMVPLEVPLLLSSGGPRLAGLAVATNTLFAAGSSLLFGRRRPRAPSATAWVARSFALMGAGYFLLGSFDTLAPRLAGLALAGVGSGWIMPSLSRSLVLATDERTRARSIGMLTSSVYAGQFLSPALSALFGERGALSSAFLVASGALVALAVALAVTATAGRTTERSPSENARGAAEMNTA